MAAILAKIYFEKCEKSPIFKDFYLSPASIRTGAIRHFGLGTMLGKAFASIQLPLCATLASRAIFRRRENQISGGRQKHNKNIFNGEKQFFQCLRR